MSDGDHSPGLLSGYEFDYVEATAPLTVTATSEGAAQTFIDGHAVVFDGSTRVKIEFWANYAQNASGDLVVSLFDGAGSIGWLSEQVAVLTPLYLVRFLTPSSGSHTYHIKAWKTGGSGTSVINAGAGGSGVDMPAWYRITKA